MSVGYAGVTYNAESKFSNTTDASLLKDRGLRLRNGEGGRINYGFEDFEDDETVFFKKARGGSACSESMTGNIVLEGDNNNIGKDSIVSLSRNNNNYSRAAHTRVTAIEKLWSIRQVQH